MGQATPCDSWAMSRWRRKGKRGDLRERWQGRCFPVNQGATCPDKKGYSPVDKALAIPSPLYDRESYSHHIGVKDSVNPTFSL